MIFLRRGVFLLILFFLPQLMTCLAAPPVQEPQTVYMIIAYPTKTSVNTSVPFRIEFYDNSTSAKMDEQLIYADMLQKYKDGISIKNKTIILDAGFDRARLTLVHDVYLKVQPPTDYYPNIIRDHQEYGWLVTPKKGPHQSLITRFVFTTTNRSNEGIEIGNLDVIMNESELFDYLIYGGLLTAILALITAYLKKSKK
jgi:hypothetical protein